MPGDPSSGDFILASASPRRHQLLRQLGLSFQVVPSKVYESEQSGMAPRAHALHWAAIKARKVASRYPDNWILAADTIVVVDGEILGKPAGRPEAEAMLTRLSGREHQVVSGVCLLLQGGGIEECRWVETRVFMRQLSLEDIEAYVSTEEPLGKAGAYAIQGIGACLVQRIEGSYTNVVGLPLYEVVELLRRHQVADPFRASAGRKHRGKRSP